jgi:hypothetical protein
VSVLAVIRPDSWFFPLFLHIAGSMALVGALTLALVYLVSAWRSGSPSLIRSAYLTLFYAALPAFIVFRAGAEWIISKEGLSDANLTWIDIGYSVSDAGFLFLIISLIIGGISVRRMKRGGTPSPVAARVVTGLVALMLIADLVAIWAMTTKPA